MRRAFLALAAALVCAACTAPIFDPTMSLAGRTIERIPRYAATSVLEAPDDFDLRADSFTFLPERVPGGFDTTKGFVIQVRDGSRGMIWYTWMNGDTASWISTDWEYSMDDAMPSQWPVWLKLGPYLGVIQLQTYAYANRLYADTASSIYWDSTYDATSDIQLDLVLLSTPHVAGMSVSGEPSDTEDRISALAWISGTQYSEATTTVNEVGVGTWASVMGTNNYDLSFLGTPWLLRYFRDFTYSRSFAQSYNGSTWTTWVWWSTTPDYAKLTTVTHRIDAVLSADAGSGASYLFSAEDQMGRIYRYDGSGTGELVAEFPLGSLRFIGEAYVDGAWRLLFSRCLIQSGSLQLEIRAIPTVDLVATFAS